MYDAAQEQIFRSIIPASALPFADVILRVAREEGVDPLVLVAVGQRESRWGAALRSLTGDFTLRGQKWASVPGTKQVNEVPPGWRLPAKRLTPPFTVPADLLGWGRGLMQIDFPNVAKLGIASWRDPEANIRAAARCFLKPAYATLRAAGVADADLTRAVFAAYNAGPANVVAAYRRGGIAAVDAITTQSYGSGTDSLLAQLNAAFDAATAAGSA